jgi:hypothetical protein
MGDRLPCRLPVVEPHVESVGGVAIAQEVPDPFDGRRQGQLLSLGRLRPSGAMAVRDDHSVPLRDGEGIPKCRDEAFAEQEASFGDAAEGARRDLTRPSPSPRRVVISNWPSSPALTQVAQRQWGWGPEAHLAIPQTGHRWTKTGLARRSRDRTTGGSAPRLRCDRGSYPTNRTSMAHSGPCG